MDSSMESRIEMLATTCRRHEATLDVHGQAARGELGTAGRERIASHAKRRLDGRAGAGNAAGTAYATGQHRKDGVMSADGCSHGHC